jgi:hypothetical protein
MSDEPENLIHRMLTDIRTVLGRVAEDVAGIKTRVTGLEIAVAGTNRRLDQVDERLERLERRAGLLEAHEAKAP